MIFGIGQIVRDNLAFGIFQGRNEGTVGQLLGSKQIAFKDDTHATNCGFDRELGRIQANTAQAFSNGDPSFGEPHFPTNQISFSVNQMKLCKVLGRSQGLRLLLEVWAAHGQNSFRQQGLDHMFRPIRLAVIDSNIDAFLAKVKYLGGRGYFDVDIGVLFKETRQMIQKPFFGKAA